jgi:hypothetical protein
MRSCRFALAIVCALAWGAPLSAQGRDGFDEMREFLKDAIILGFAATPSGEWLVSSNSLYRSKDGKTWTLVGPEIDMGGAVHVASDGIYAVGTDSYSPDRKVRLPEGDRVVGLYRSTDAGATWKVVHAWKQAELEPTAVLRTPKGALVVGHGSLFGVGKKGIVRSTDDGRTWVSASSQAWVLAMDAAPDGALYAATDDGVLVSADDGASWTPTSRTEMTALVRAQGAVLYAGGINGLHRSADKGKTWTLVDSTKETVALPVVLSKEKVGVVTQSMTTGEVALQLSRDGGKTWTAAGSKLEPMTVDVVFSDGRAIYLGTRRGKGVLRSGDDGATFEKIFP